MDRIGVYVKKKKIKMKQKEENGRNDERKIR